MWGVTLHLTYVKVAKERVIKMNKKFDKEYSTQYLPEMDFLKEQGIKPVFVKTINNVETYKYTKTKELFLALVEFYD